MIANTAARFTDLEGVAIGETVSISRSITAAAIDAFAELSGDDNPLHLSDNYAQSAGFPSRVSHGALLVAHLSNLLGTKFPGPGCLWLKQQLQWRLPVFVGDVVEITATVKHKSLGTRTLLLSIEARNQTGALVMNGEAMVAIPGGGIQ
jgi:acyl dehydratase